MMIDTPILTILMAHTLVSMTVWNTNDDRYSNFDNLYENKSLKRWNTSFCSQGFVNRTVWNTPTVIDTTVLVIFLDFGHILKMWKRLFVEMYLHFLISPIT